MKPPHGDTGSTESCICTCYTDKSSSNNSYQRSFNGKYYTPTRESKLLNKMIKAKLAPNDNRYILLSRSIINLNGEVQLPASKNFLEKTKRSSDIFELVELVDKSAISGPRKISGSCSCSNCMSKDHAHKDSLGLPRYTHTTEVGSIGPRSSVSSKLQLKVQRRTRKRKFKAKNIKSDPCTSTSKFTDHNKSKPHVMHTKYPQEALPNTEYDLVKVSGEQRSHDLREVTTPPSKSKQYQMKQHLHKVLNESTEKLKVSRRVITDTLNASRKIVQNYALESSHNKNNRTDNRFLEKFKEHLDNQSHLLDWGCDMKCQPDNCYPEECLDKITYKIVRKLLNTKLNESNYKKLNVSLSMSNAGVQVKNDNASKQTYVTQRTLNERNIGALKDNAPIKPDTLLKRNEYGNPRNLDKLDDTDSSTEINLKKAKQKQRPKNAKFVKINSNGSFKKNQLDNNKSFTFGKGIKQKLRKLQRNYDVDSITDLRRHIILIMSDKLENQKLNNNSNMGQGEIVKNRQVDKHAPKRCFCTLKIKPKSTRSKTDKSMTKVATNRNKISKFFKRHSKGNVTKSIQTNPIQKTGSSASDMREDLKYGLNLTSLYITDMEDALSYSIKRKVQKKSGQKPKLIEGNHSARLTASIFSLDKTIYKDKFCQFDDNFKIQKAVQTKMNRKIIRGVHKKVDFTDLRKTDLIRKLSLSQNKTSGRSKYIITKQSFHRRFLKAGGNIKRKSVEPIECDPKLCFKKLRKEFKGLPSKEVRRDTGKPEKPKLNTKSKSVFVKPNVKQKKISVGNYKPNIYSSLDTKSDKYNGYKFTHLLNINSSFNCNIVLSGDTISSVSAVTNTVIDAGLKKNKVQLPAESIIVSRMEHLDLQPQKPTISPTVKKSYALNSLKDEDNQRRHLTASMKLPTETDTASAINVAKANINISNILTTDNGYLPSNMSEPSYPDSYQISHNCLKQESYSRSSMFTIPYKSRNTEYLQKDIDLIGVEDVRPTLNFITSKEAVRIESKFSCIRNYLKYISSEIRDKRRISKKVHSPNYTQSKDLRKPEPKNIPQISAQQCHLTGLPELLKKSYCTMNIQVGKKKPPSNLNKLEPYECEPEICVPYECDPYECQKLIIKRLQKNSSKMSSTSMKLKSSSTFVSSKPSLRPKKLQLYPVRKQQENHKTEMPTGGTYPTEPLLRRAQRQGVRAGSPLRLDLDFTKNKSKPSAARGDFTTPGAKPSSTSKSSKTAEIHYKTQSIKGYDTHKQDKEAQSAINKIRHKGSSVSPVQKKCFCTLKLQKKGIKPKKRDFRVSQDTDTKVVEPEREFELLAIAKKREADSILTKITSSSTIAKHQKIPKDQKVPSRKSHKKPVKSESNESKLSRQEAKIGSSDSYRVDFYKDKSPGSGSYHEFNLPGERKSRDAKYTEVEKIPKHKKTKHRQMKEIKSRDSSSKGKVARRNKDEIIDDQKHYQMITTNSLLKRCFCTLKFISNTKKTDYNSVKNETLSPIKTDQNITQTSKRYKPVPDLTDIQNINKNTKVIDLLPYECEPDICVPGVCNPVECIQFIQKRNAKDQMSGLEKPITKSTGSSFMSSRTSKARMTFKKVTNTQERDKAQRQKYIPQLKGKISPQHLNALQTKAVRIGSSFSFDIEFSKENFPSYVHVQNGAKAIKDLNNVQPSLAQYNARENHKMKSTASKSTGKHSVMSRNKSAQSRKAVNVMDSQVLLKKMHSTMTGMGPLLKRCFCTLQLQKYEKDSKQFQKLQKDIGKIQTDLKDKQHVKTVSIGTDSQKIKVQIKPKKGQEMRSTKMYIRKNLELYECEPGVCSPGECDPYACLKMIRKRRMQTKQSGTEKYITHSISSATGKEKNPKSKAVSSSISEKKNVNPKDEQAKFKSITSEQPPVKSSYSTSPSRQALVHIGSSYSFDIELLKDKTSEVPVQDVIGHKQIKTKSEKIHKKPYKGTETKAKRTRSISSYKRSHLQDHPSQSVSVNTENKGSRVGPLLKRCFCTLKLQKGSTKQKTGGFEATIKSASAYTTSKNKVDSILKSTSAYRKNKNEIEIKPTAREFGTMTKIIAKNLDPYDCEPRFCKPGECDPLGCLDRVKLRHMNNSVTGSKHASIRSMSIRTTPRGKRTIKTQMRKEKRPKKLITSTETVHTSKKYEQAPHSTLDIENINRKAISIGSNFSFDMEFYNEKITNQGDLYRNEIKPYYTPTALKPVLRNSQTSYATIDGIKTKNRSIHSNDFLIKHRNFQSTGPKTDSSGSGRGPVLKRCFCTLTLQRAEVKGTNPVAQSKKKSVKTSEHQKAEAKQTEAKQTDAKQTEPRKRRSKRTENKQAGMQDASTGTKKKYNPRPVIPNLDDYECEPGICVPGECDPYECLERLRRRGIRRISRKTGTRMKRDPQVSVSSMAAYLRPGTRCNQTQCAEEHNVERIVEEPRFAIFDNKRKQSVRISSNFSFNIEFFKEITPQQGSPPVREVRRIREPPRRREPPRIREPPPRISEPSPRRPVYRDRSEGVCPYKALCRQKNTCTECQTRDGHHGARRAHTNTCETQSICAQTADKSSAARILRRCFCTAKLIKNNPHLALTVNRCEENVSSPYCRQYWVQYQTQTSKNINKVEKNKGNIEMETIMSYTPKKFKKKKSEMVFVKTHNRNAVDDEKYKKKSKGKKRLTDKKSCTKMILKQTSKPSLIKNMICRCIHIFSKRKHNSFDNTQTNKIQPKIIKKPPKYRLGGTDQLLNTEDTRKENGSRLCDQPIHPSNTQVYFTLTPESNNWHQKQTTKAGVQFDIREETPCLCQDIKNADPSCNYQAYENPCEKKDVVICTPEDKSNGVSCKLKTCKHLKRKKEDKGLCSDCKPKVIKPTKKKKVGPDDICYCKCPGNIETIVLPERQINPARKTCYCCACRKKARVTEKIAYMIRDPSEPEDSCACKDKKKFMKMLVLTEKDRKRCLCCVCSKCKKTTEKTGYIVPGTSPYHKPGCLCEDKSRPCPDSAYLTSLGTDCICKHKKGRHSYVVHNECPERERQFQQLQELEELKRSAAEAEEAALKKTNEPKKERIINFNITSALRNLKHTANNFITNGTSASPESEKTETRKDNPEKSSCQNKCLDELTRTITPFSGHCPGGSGQSNKKKSWYNTFSRPACIGPYPGAIPTPTCLPSPTLYPDPGCIPTPNPKRDKNSPPRRSILSTNQEKPCPGPTKCPASSRRSAFGCINIFMKPKLPNLKKAKKLPKECICKSEICQKEAKEGPSKKKKQKELVCKCGAKICGAERRRIKDEKTMADNKVKINLSKLKEKHKKAEKKQKKKKERKKEQRSQYLEEITDLQYLKLRNQFLQEDELRRKMRLKQENEDLRQVETYKRKSSNVMLIAESALDVTKLGINSAKDILRCVIKAVKYPRYTIRHYQHLAKHPDDTWEKVKSDADKSRGVYTLKRVKARLGATTCGVVGKEAAARSSLGNFLLNLGESNPSKRVMKPKAKRKREPIDFQCSPFMLSLRRKPWLAVYYACPWFYPHCINCLAGWRTFTDAMLFLLAVVVWSPCIIAIELGRAIVCCSLCTG